MSVTRLEAVVIGASAGAIDALSVILPPLPADYPLPVVVIVHLPVDKRSVLAELFQATCAMQAHEAEDKRPLESGSIYFGPPNYHLLIEPEKLLSLSVEEPINYSRPSIDVLFESAADAYGSNLLGVVLSGASCDGARGLKAIIDAGGVGLVQRPDLAHASVMPLAALSLCPDARSTTLEEIRDYMLRIGDQP